MIVDPVLKKFGLFEASKSIQNLNNNASFMMKTPTKLSTQRKDFNQTLSVNRKTTQTPDRVSSNSGKSYNTGNRQHNGSHNRGSLKSNENVENVNKLQKLITYLKSNYCKFCKNHSEKSYKIKFVCLEQCCSQNLGCAECFLYKHSDHQKAEIGTCLRDLEHLDMLMKDSYDIIISQKAVIKQQFMKQVELELQNMREQFEQNINFLHSKASKQINEHLFSRYDELQILFNLRDKGGKIEEDSQILTELLKIDIKGIQRDLCHQIEDLAYQKFNYQPVIKMFEQMNGALGHFMAEFKKCFPKIYQRFDYKIDGRSRLDRGEREVGEFVCGLRNQNEKLNKEFGERGQQNI